MIYFIFDLDGTVTKTELLPLIASNFQIGADIASLTSETVLGNIPFMESFIRRVHFLGKLPVDRINKLVSQVPLFDGVASFINENRHCCVIATGNLDCWIAGLASRLGCVCHSSLARVEHNQVSKLIKIVKKEEVVSQLQASGHKVVFVGDGNNDLEAMRTADISIATGLAHAPAPAILSVADYLVYSEKALCRLLNQLLG